MVGIGPTKFDRLIDYFPSVKEAYNASPKVLRKLLGDSLSEKFITFRNNFNPEKELERMNESNITILTREDPRFPPQLMQLPDPPICIYVKGELSSYSFDSDLYFAIVGTRNPTFYGEQVARKFAYELAQEDMIIVSGLALGIDAIAHTAALDAGKRTIAFLGCGVDIPYPPSNRSLYHRIIEKGGLVISEVPPDMRVMRGLFVQRNRLISGLSKGILVAEGLKDSGSLITARFAAEQGKDVFAPPAPITSEYSEAPNILIKEGAKLVTSTNDILEEYSMSLRNQKLEDVLDKLSDEEKSIYTLLMSQPLGPDEIARTLEKPVYQVLTVLSALELRGVIESKGSIYTIRIG